MNIRKLLLKKSFNMNFIITNKFNLCSKIKNNKIEVETENIKRKLNNLYRFHEKPKGEEVKQEEIKEEETKEESKTETVSLSKKIFDGIKNLWNQTFPPEKDYDKLNLEQIEIAKLLKSKIKWAKEDEFEKYQSTVEAWKHTAIILLEETITEENNSSKLEYYIKSLSEKIHKSEVYSKIKETKTFKEYEQFKEDLYVIQSNIKENIAMSYNPAVVLFKDVVEKVTVKSTSSEAFIIMRKHDPDFDFYELEHRASIFLKIILKAEFEGNLELIEALCAENALAVESAKIKYRKEKGLEMKLKEPIYIDNAMYHNSVIVDADNVRFQFIINVQENNCLIDKEGNIQDGKASLLENCHYVIEVWYDPEAQVDVIGHNWIVTKLERTGVVEQLI